MAIKLGQKVKDIISGFEGVVTGHVEYITGCNQALVQPAAKPDGDFVDNRWIDDDRLRIVNAEPISLKITHAGPDTQAPRR
jgi:hypothetical protein